MRTYNPGGYCCEETYFPSNSVLEEAVLNARKELGGEATTEQINHKVIEILKLPDEFVHMEDESGLSKKLNYRLRWSRTNLKSLGQIKTLNEAFGLWIKLLRRSYVNI